LRRVRFVTLDLSVGLEPARTGEPLFEPEFGRGRTKHVGTAVHLRVVSQEPLHPYAVRGVERHCASQKGCAGLGSLVSMDLRVRQAAVVADGRVDVFVACAALVRRSIAPKDLVTPSRGDPG